MSNILKQQVLQELPHIAEARKYLGMHENTNIGKQNIRKWLDNNVGGGFLKVTDSWCGTFVAHCLKTWGFTRAKNGVRGTPKQYPFNWYRALAYQTEGGVKLNKPCYGCVAVKSRQGGGHVTFVVGRTPQGRLVCLGGNQSDMVCFALYNESDFSSFMWYGHTGTPAQGRYSLPILTNVTKVATKES